MPPTEHYGAHQASWPGDPPPDWEAQNRGITPVFRIDTVPLPNGDTLDIECCTLQIAGDSLTEAAVIVDDAIRARFAERYADWKAGRETCTGDLLEDWGLLTPKQVNELNANNVYSVQDLASLSDGNCGCVPHGRQLRDKAAAWLKKREAAAPAKAMAEANARLQGQINTRRRRSPSSPRLGRSGPRDRRSERRLNHARDQHGRACCKCGRATFQQLLYAGRQPDAGTAYELREALVAEQNRIDAELKRLGGPK